MSSFLAVIPEDVDWMTRDLPDVILDGRKLGTSVLKSLRTSGLIEIVGNSSKSQMRALRIWRLTEYGKTRKGEGGQ
jgi:hypothetical protein